MVGCEQVEEAYREESVKTFGDGYHGTKRPCRVLFGDGRPAGENKNERGIPMEKLNTNDMPNEYIMTILRAAVKMSPEELREFTAKVQQVLQEQQGAQALSA